MPERSDPATIVIAGNGMVGHRLCERLVAKGVAGRRRVVVFAEETRPAYDRIHLIDGLNGRSVESLGLSSPGWYAEHGFELRLGETVVAIDRRAKRVHSSTGEEVAYGTLVLATGSRPFRPPIAGIDREGVCVYRTIDDVLDLRRRIEHAQDAVIVGGGLLGLEAARGLLDHGLRVTVVEAASGLLCRQLDPAASLHLRERIEQLGVIVHLGSPPRDITERGPRRVLRLANGIALEADLIVVAAGIRPRDELALDAGLAVGPRGGTVVDDRLCTGDPDIFAIGECAAHRGRPYGLAAPGYRMAEILAENLCGGAERFEGGEFSTALKVFGAGVAILGENLAPGDVLEHRRERELRQIVVRRGRLIGATLVGDGCGDAAPRLQEAIDQGRLVWPWQLRRFRRSGSPWPARDEPVALWPPGRVVCQCLGITRGALAEAAANGAREAATLSRATGAATVCGSCTPLLAALVGAAGTEARRPFLAAASILALAAALLVAVVGPVPLSTSVVGASSLDVLWRSPLARQVSGFTLLGLCALAGTIVFRRRTRRFDRLGDFASWRMAHAAIGLGALGLLAVHTGFRLGDNFNLVVVASFLAVSFAGGAAGSAAARVLAVDAAAAQRWQRRLAAIHAALTWPFPVLVLFHVITVYYF